MSIAAKTGYVRRVRKVRRDGNGEMVTPTSSRLRLVSDDHTDRDRPRPLSMAELAPAFLKELRQRAQFGYGSVPTGLVKLDEYLDEGLPRGQTTVLAASPGFGKTTLALGIAYRHASEDHPVLFASLELPRFDAMSRIVSMQRGEPWSRVRQGSHRTSARAVMDQMAGFPFYLADQSDIDSMETLERYAKDIADRYGEGPLVVIDHVQLLTDLQSIPEMRRGADLVASEVLKLAIDHDCPVLLLSSVARHSYNVSPTDRVRVLAMAKESGRFESDAAVVMAILIADASDRRDQRGWIVVAKNRLAGDVGQVPISFDGLTGAFCEVSPDDVRSLTEQRTNEQVCGEILQAVAEGELTSVEAIREAVNIKKPRATRLVRKLLAEEKMEKNGRVYCIKESQD